MMRYSWFGMAGLMVGAAAVLSTSCSEEDPAVSDSKPRAEPTFASSGHAGTQPAGTMPAGTHAAALPAGHPPIGATTESPAGGEPEVGLKIDFPKEWEPRRTRMMTLRVYAAPKVEGDSEDADVALSELGAKVPLQMNINRWCEQFGLPAGPACAAGARQQTLEGTQHPTTVVEISGTYKASSMMGGPAEPKAHYRMVAAEIVTPDRPYYIKMIGPEKTVERWKGPLLDAVKAAK